MKKIIPIFLGFIVFFGIAIASFAEQNIAATKVAAPPVIDGAADETVWQQVKEYITHDKVADIPITLKAVYTDTEIFFLVTFPDADESITHKSWVWDKDSQLYQQGPDREDCFVLKWNMAQAPVDLSVKADNSYIADIWFWKACRSNPVGYADDKYDQYDENEIPKSMKVISKSGKTMYIRRDGDSGMATCEDIIYPDYQGDNLARFKYLAPTGSRADVKAKGKWSDGKWTIEFSRALNTGNSDDVQFDISKEYLFGVSRYEIAGREPDPNLGQPLYGCGDVGEALMLQFEK